MRIFPTVFGQNFLKNKIRINFLFRDGASRTGLFLVLANLIEQINNTNTLDVFRTVKDLRNMRPGAVNSLVRQKKFFFLKELEGFLVKNVSVVVEQKVNFKFFLV